MRFRRECRTPDATRRMEHFRRPALSEQPAMQAAVRLLRESSGPSASLLVDAGGSCWQQKTAGPNPRRFLNLPFGLLLVYRLLQFGPRAKLRDFAGSDLDRSAGLWVAPVARFSLRHREGAEAYQSHPISFAEGRCNAVHGGINGSRGLRFADFTCARDLVNQIGLIHEILLAGLFSCPAWTGGKTGCG